MSKEVIFRAIDGALKDEEFVFDEKGLCLIGRSSDCALLIPKEKDMRISRRHCLLILNPPKVRIRDLGSRNGTFLNDKQLVGGELGDVPEQISPVDKTVNDGDRISIGETVFEIIIPSQKKAGAPLEKPPQGTKIIKLTKPAKTRTGTLIPKITPVDSGFFVAPKVPGARVPSTATAPLTELFVKPAVSGTTVQKPKKVLKGRIVKKPVRTEPAGRKNDARKE